MSTPSTPTHTERQLAAARICCGTDELRPAMHDPFHQEGWNLATDAHLIFGWQGEPVTTGHEKAPRALGFILDEAQPLPEPFVLNLSALNAAIESIPKIAGPCTACNGSKSCTCPECEQKHECGYCKGSGHDPYGKADQPDPYARVLFKGGARFIAKKLLKVRDVMRALELDSITITHGALNRAHLAKLPGGERLLFMVDMVGDDDEIKATITNGQQ